MEVETLTKANELLKQIRDLEEHYEAVKTEKADPYIPKNDMGVGMRVEPYCSGPVKLRNDYLPISIPDFVWMYLGKLEQEIKRLRKEFDGLCG